MEVDPLDQNVVSTTSLKENCVLPRPVSPNTSGVGLPYAPQDWPKPGDNWRWKVGRRFIHGYFSDRCLYAPRRLCMSSEYRYGFRSKRSIRRYIQNEHPGEDVEMFFASFTWKVPLKKQYEINDNDDDCIPPTMPVEEMVLNNGSETVACKAGNKNCISLVEETGDNILLPSMDCDICCSEAGFCRDCCCILCCMTVKSSTRSYNFVRCESKVGGDYICGHVAHIQCAFRTFMAGTVGGSIGLDAEYYCRRCDARTDLVSHSLRLLQTAKSSDSRNEIEAILRVGICILRGSHKDNAKRLLDRIRVALDKLKSATCLGDIWKEDCIEIAPPDVTVTSIALEDDKNHKLEVEIDETLRALKRSQEFEYGIAEGKLRAQKNYVLNLYHKHEIEKGNVAKRSRSSNKSSALRKAISERENQIQQEIMKLKSMEEVAKGFGKTSKTILKKHFGLEICNS